VPALFGVTRNDTVADAALFSVPRLQVTVVVPLHEPLTGVAETKVARRGAHR